MTVTQSPGDSFPNPYPLNKKFGTTILYYTQFCTHMRVLTPDESESLELVVAKINKVLKF